MLESRAMAADKYRYKTFGIIIYTFSAHLLQRVQGFTEMILQLFPDKVTILYFTKMGNPA